MADETLAQPNSDDPSVVSDAVSKMQGFWDITCALMGGTAAMRAAGEKFLPRYKMEEGEDYQERIGRSTLLPAFKETVKKMTGRVFADPLKLGADIPQFMWDEKTETGVLDNVDLQGRSIHVFAREVFEKAVEKGHSFILCEAPKKDPAIKTQEQEAAAGLRPYFVHVQPERMLGWIVDENSGQLTQCRIQFTTERKSAKNKYQTECVRQIRVYELNSGAVTVETFELEKDSSGKEKWVSKGIQATGFQEIPLIAVYTNRTGFFTSEPPLLECAYLNLQHWQEKSGLDNLTAVAKIPILTYNGDTDNGKMIVIGASYVTKLPVGSELKYVEHTGAAIEAGEAQLKRIEAEMRDAGAKLLQQGSANAVRNASKATGAKTATQVSEEAAADNSALGMMVQDFQDALEDALDIMAQTRGEASGGEIECQPNLDPDTSPIDTVTTLISMANSGKLSAKTLFLEAQRRGLLSSDLDWETEQVQILEELQSMGLNAPPRKPGPLATGATGPMGATGPGATGPRGPTGPGFPATGSTGGMTEGE